MGGNEHHIWCNRHGFQPETTYPAFRRAAFLQKYPLFSTGVMANRNYAVPLSTRRRMYRSSTCVESWRFCPTAFLLRSGEFIPRHPFVIRFSRCNRGCLSPLIPYLGKIQRLTTKKSENFFQFLENGFFALAHRLLCHTEMLGNLFLANRCFGQI